MTTTEVERTGGVARVVAALRWRVLDPQHTDCLVRNVHTPVRPTELAAPYVGRTVTDRDDPDIALLPHDRQRAARRHLAAGDVCHLVLARNDDATLRAAAWTWWTTRSHRDPWSGIRIRLLPNESFTYDLWVAPDDRRHGLARWVMGQMLTHAAAAPGIDVVYELIEKHNRESQALNRMVYGFRSVQDIRNVCVLNRWGFSLPGSVTPGNGPLSASRTVHLPPADTGA